MSREGMAASGADRGGGDSIGHLRGLFEAQRASINHFFDTVDLREVNAVADLVVACAGTIVFCGVGKSAIVARKICQSMVSVGVRSVCLNPIEALHGDVGIVEEGDVVMLFSKSGETSELLNLVPYLRVKKAHLVAVSCNAGSSLAGAADTAVTLPLDRELCPFNLSPTTSAVLQLVFGDTLSVALMERTGFSKRQYAENHPAGRIGRRLTLKVDDLMVKGDDLPLCAPDASLSAFLTEMAKGCGGVMVVEDDRRLVGLFSDGDLRRGLVESGGTTDDLSVRKLMTPADRLRRCRRGALAFDAMADMEKGRPVNFLPVLDDDGRIVGVLRLHDCVRAGL